MHMSATMASASVLMNWTHEKTADSDEIQCVHCAPYHCLSLMTACRIIATLFPKDGCRLKFTPRPRPEV
jgi:C-22 sterol desaturase